MRFTVAFAVALLAASAAEAQFVTVPFGGPRKVRPSAALTLRGATPDLAGAVAAKSRPAAATDLDEARHPVEVLQFLGLPLGATALVAAADPAYYAEIIGTAVGASGRVTALVSPALMKDAAGRAAISGVVSRAPAVSIRAVAADAVRLDADRYDFALVDRFDAARSSFLPKLYAAIRPGGIVGVIDRGDAAAAQADFVRAGFVFESASDLLKMRAGSPAKFETDAAAADATDRFILRVHKPE